MIYFYYFMCVGALSICMCLSAIHVCSAKGHKRVLDPLELEPHMLMSLSVGAGNQTQVPWKSSQCF